MACGTSAIETPNTSSWGSASRKGIRRPWPPPRARSSRRGPTSSSPMPMTRPRRRSWRPRSVPIVFASVADPLGTGLVHSFAAPGGNVTGVADLGLELSPKRLELFREVIPDLRRVLYLYPATDASSRAALTLYHEAARALGLELVAQAVRSEAEAQATLAQSQKGEVDGILAPPSLAFNLPGAILTAAAQRGLPTMFSIHGRFLVEHGGLVSYGADRLRLRPAGGTAGREDQPRHRARRDPRRSQFAARTRHQPAGRGGARLHDRAAGVVSGGSPDPLSLAACQDDKQRHASLHEEPRRSRCVDDHQAWRACSLVSLTLASLLLVPGVALAVEVGEQAPDFTLPSTTGEPISLRQFRGKTARAPGILRAGPRPHVNEEPVSPAG